MSMSSGLLVRKGGARAEWLFYPRSRIVRASVMEIGPLHTWIVLINFIGLELGLFDSFNRSSQKRLGFISLQCSYFISVEDEL